MARVAYVALTHGGADPIRRLVSTILRSSPEAHVFVAHDDRRERAPEIDDARVTVWSHHRASDWGSWDLVAGTLAAFRETRAVFDPDLLVLISGQHYPARPLAAWEAAFLARGGWEGQARPLQYAPAWGRRRGTGDDDLTRYVYRWIRVPSLSKHLPDRVVPTWRRLADGIFLRTEPVLSYRVLERAGSSRIGIRRIRTPFDEAHPAYKGSQWMAMDREHLDLVLRVAAEPLIASTYRHSVIPDEGLIPTVLSWHAQPQAGRGITYMDWDGQLHSPRTLTLDDLDPILASGLPFCRKVDPHASAALMDALDVVNRARP